MAIPRPTIADSSHEQAQNRLAAGQGQACHIGVARTRPWHAPKHLKTREPVTWLGDLDSNQDCSVQSREFYR
jgi:hypothetical protein